jgi:hypothetical protein
MAANVTAPHSQNIGFSYEFTRGSLRRKMAPAEVAHLNAADIIP